MAFSNSTLLLRESTQAGKNSYNYTTTDTIKTVLTAGYIDNEDALVNFVAGDRIFVEAADGYCWVKVASVSSGTATLQWISGNLAINTAATGTEAALSAALVPGFLEAGTSISTATRYVLPTPYAGAEFTVNRVDSGTQAMEFDAGGSGATGITYDGSARRIMLKARTEGFRVVGSSATRWRLMDLRYNASAVSEGGSVVFLGT